MDLRSQPILCDWQAIFKTMGISTRVFRGTLIHTVTLEYCSKTRGIPPTEVGGLFRSNLHAAVTDSLNPTNGSWWIVQILSTKEDLRNLRKSTNGSWWIVQIQPTRVSLRILVNPTNGSWWDFGVFSQYSKATGVNENF